MTSIGSLDNYIEMQRLRGGLSLDELSFLISVEGKTTWRYEKSVRVPNLETLLALEIVLGKSISDLYAGVAERIRTDVTKRARMLLERIDDTPTKETALKLDLLSRLARTEDDVSIIPIWPEER